MGTSKQTYTIGELAREFDITTRTIRFYEDEGLLSPQRNGQHRIYENADRTRLKLILRGKRLGFSLSESKELIQMYNPDSNNRDQLEAVLKKIDEKRRQLQQQLNDIDVMQRELDNAEARCQQTIEQHIAKHEAPSSNTE